MKDEKILDVNLGESHEEKWTKEESWWRTKYFFYVGLMIFVVIMNGIMSREKLFTNDLTKLFEIGITFLSACAFYFLFWKLDEAFISRSYNPKKMVKMKQGMVSIALIIAFALGQILPDVLL